jgi:tRNA (cmo5U34)-methyltransferase
MTTFRKSHWSKVGFSQEYRDNADIYVIERARMLIIVQSLYRYFMKNKRKRNMLDLGCGDGIVAHELLKVGRSASATLLDGSPDMLDAARVRLKDFGNVRYVQAGFQELLKKEVLHENYDFIASSLAIHHLTMKEKKALFRKIYQHLCPGGYFVNIDCVLAPSETLEQLYMTMWKEWIDEKKRSLGISGNYFDDIIRRYKDNKDNKPDTLEDQLGALKAIGYKDTDCFYKYGVFAIYGGRK